KGFLSFDKKGISEDKIMEAALDAGAEDIIDAGETWDVTSAPADFEKVKEALASFKPLTAEISKIPQNTVELADPGDAQKMLNLMEALEDHEDVQKVYANFDIPAAVMEKMS
ncbi:MAG: YebC/PmpR family DNA-binding transcriptional regulator, partial [Deltaproteobacteria bacterium]|nr:YebC/PmpR family DNA-binding transcriptional regulator [Deltaproteobacteria bacterium]